MKTKYKRKEVSRINFLTSEYKLTESVALLCYYSVITATETIIFLHA